jgi:hypothetical protein
MFIDPNGAVNYPQCQGSDTILTPLFNKTNFTISKDQALTLLDAIETDFSCAAMCTTSLYYTFSDIRRGIP